MLRDTLEMNIKRLIDFLLYSKNFLIRKNPIKAMSNSFVEGIKEFLTMNKKDGTIQIKLSPSSVSKNGTADCRK